MIGLPVAACAPDLCLSGLPLEGVPGWEGDGPPACFLGEAEWAVVVYSGEVRPRSRRMLAAV